MFFFLCLENLQDFEALEEHLIPRILQTRRGTSILRTSIETGWIFISLAQGTIPSQDPAISIKNGMFLPKGAEKRGARTMCEMRRYRRERFKDLDIIEPGQLS